MLMQKEINSIFKSLENIEKVLGKRKQIEVTYIDTSDCNPRQSMDACHSPNCSWFNHSQVHLQGGDLPPEVTER